MNKEFERGFFVGVTVMCMGLIIITFSLTVRSLELEQRVEQLEEVRYEKNR